MVIGSLVPDRDDRRFHRDEQAKQARQTQTILAALVLEQINFDDHRRWRGILKSNRLRRNRTGTLTNAPGAPPQRFHYRLRTE